MKRDKDITQSGCYKSRLIEIQHICIVLMDIYKILQMKNRDNPDDTMNKWYAMWLWLRMWMWKINLDCIQSCRWSFASQILGVNQNIVQQLIVSDFVLKAALIKTDMIDQKVLCTEAIFCLVPEHMSSLFLFSITWNVE